MSLPNLRRGALAMALLAAACAAPADPPLAAADLPAGAVLLTGRAPASHPKAVRPAPTEHVLDEGAEASNRSLRKAWIRERHRAPPGFDWQAAERANGEAAIARRNGMASLAVAAGTRWTERGSDNLAGRMHAITPSTDGSMIYAGSSKGGVWRSLPDGSSWEPLGDNLYGGAHWLVTVPGATPADPDVILAATDGGLIHVSRDDGATWEVPTGLPSTVGVRRAFVHPGSGSVFVLARWWAGGDLRTTLYRSTDGAASFTKSLGMLTYWGDVWTPRDASGQLYALKQDEIQISHDDGVTWSVVGSTGVTSNGGELTGSEAGAPRLWAILDENGTRRLRRSNDGGASFQFVTDVSDYWGTLCASITDVDLFAWGGVEVHVTRNAGNSFAIVNPWWEYYGQEATKLHADIPGLDAIPDGQGGETWYVSTDGGLYESHDGLLSVNNLSLDGLRVSQYYDTHTSSFDEDHVIAGAQDQGYQRADQPAPDALQFDQLISGDYGHLTSSGGAHAWLYSVYPGFVLVQQGETNPTLHQVDFPAGESHGWMPTIRADPDAPTRWYLCASHLYRYRRNNPFNTWTLEQWSAQDFEGSPGEYLTALVFSPLDSDVAFAATNHGRLFRSDDHAVTWTESNSTGPGAHYFYGTALVASALDPDLIYVGGSGYGSPAVRRSTDGGLTYQGYSAGLPDTLAYDLAEAPDGTLYAATETSAWKREPGSPAWVDITANDAPITTYWSVEIVPGKAVARFGTYGRGMWDYALDAPCGYEAYGVGLGGSNVLSLDTTSDGSLGTTHTLSATGGVPNETGYLVLGLVTAQLPIFGGSLLIDPGAMALIPIAADGVGTADVPIPVPLDPGLAGVELAWQVVLRDGSQPGGWALSNGLLGTFCQP